METSSILILIKYPIYVYFLMNNNVKITINTKGLYKMEDLINSNLFKLIVGILAF